MRARPRVSRDRPPEARRSALEVFLLTALVVVALTQLAHFLPALTGVFERLAQEFPWPR